MNIKTTSRYLLREFRSGLVWFYGIMAAIYIVGLILIATSGGIRGSFGGVDFASVIFLFVAGLNSFRESFGMLLQNGVSRKTMFVCRILTFGAVALFMSVINLVVSVLIGFLPAANREMQISINGSSFFVTTGPIGMGDILLALLFNFSLLLLALTLGYCITTLFYRLSPIGKAIVATSVPIGLTIVLPLVDQYFFGNNISRALGRFAAFALGLNGGSPWMPVITFFVASALFAFFGWLLTRRATVKR